MNKMAAAHRLKVEGMDCASCALKIETALMRLPGVEAVNVSVTGGTVTVTEGATAPSLPDLQAAIRRLGFGVDDHARHDDHHHHHHDGGGEEH